MTGNTFVGIGFGAIQGGLFLYEALQSGKFDRLVVAEVLPDVVSAVRDAGFFRVNIATASGVEQAVVDGIEILNPANTDDCATLVDAIAGASAIATALPSVEFYEKGSATVAGLLSEGIRERLQGNRSRPCVVYTAENHNHAAERLEKAVRRGWGDDKKLSECFATSCGFLNTVIGKMSQVLTDPAHIDAGGLARIAPGLDRAFLVEAFNRILVSRCNLHSTPVGIDVFVEKSNLLPFEEAKLYGHNATHALIGYLSQGKGYVTMSEALGDESLRRLAREAFLRESGAPLISRYRGIDPLFTEDGYRVYVDDLLARMSNPYLQDRVERVIRDPERKLGWDDRLIGTMRLALSAGVEPRLFARGAAAALRCAQPGIKAADVGAALRAIWPDVPEKEAAAVIAGVEKAWHTELL